MNRTITILLIGLFTTISGNLSASKPVIVPRLAEWATLVAVVAGLPNLFRVNANLYRVAQPSREGFIFLSTHTSLSNPDLPIKTLVSLRSSNKDIVLNPDDSGLQLGQISFCSVTLATLPCPMLLKTDNRCFRIRICRH